VVGDVFRRAAEKRASVLPLVANISRPSPAIGWWNQEHPSFLERASAKSDLVLALALTHHLLVSERIPLAEIARLFAALTTRTLIVEYVGPADPRFREITRGREALFGYLTPEYFERVFSERFTIIRREGIAGADRTLYRMERKSG
jgi:hypothetical protein